MTAILAIAVSFVLYETLPPLGDTTDPTDPKAPDYHFSRSYLAARHKFLTRATAAGATLASEVIYHDAEIGVNLTMDAAFFKGSRPEKLLVHISGTHGVEGFAGSAIQAKLLEGLSGGKTGGASVLFVHAVNPYGFHFGRRFNENNVDLNRNWMWSEEEWQQALSRAPNANGYEDVRALFTPTVRSWWDFFTLFVKSIPEMRHKSAIKAAAVSGQYHHREGIFFGGFRREASTQALDRILQRFAHRVSHFVSIDVHTGLGQYAEDTLMVPAADVPQVETIVSESRYRIDPIDEHAAATVVSGGYGGAMGMLKPRTRTGARFSGTVFQEFGTRPGFVVLSALVAENSAFHQTHPHSVARTFLRKVLLSVFFVDETAWKENVLRRGVDLYAEIHGSLSAA